MMMPMPWWMVLGFTAQPGDVETVRARWRKLVADLPQLFPMRAQAVDVLNRARIEGVDALQGRAVGGLAEGGAVQAEPGTEVVRWVPVEVALPGSTKTVLITLRDEQTTAWLGFRIDGQWYAVDGDAADVSHWAEPLVGAVRAGGVA